MKDNKIEEIKQIMKDLINSEGVQHTLKLVPSSQRELFIWEMEKYLLFYLLTAYEQAKKATRKQLLDEIIEDISDGDILNQSDEYLLHDSADMSYRDAHKNIIEIIKSKYNL